MGTKLESLLKHVADGQQRTQQQRVLFAITTASGWGWSLTRQQIEEITKIRTSSVCARLNELIALGKIEERGTARCTITDKTVTVYGTPRPVPAALAYKPIQPLGAYNG